MNRIHYKPCCTTPAMLCHPLLDHSTSFYVVHSCRATPCHLVPSLLCNDSPAMWYHPLPCGATPSCVVPLNVLWCQPLSLWCQPLPCHATSFHVNAFMLHHLLPCCVTLAVSKHPLPCHATSFHAMLSCRANPSHEHYRSTTPCSQ